MPTKMQAQCLSCSDIPGLPEGSRKETGISWRVSENPALIELVPIPADHGRYSFIEVDHGVLLPVLGHPQPRPCHRLGQVLGERGRPSVVQARGACLATEEGAPPQPSEFASHLTPQHGLQVIVKAISLRLGSVLVDVVHPNQTYTVLSHSIFDNLYLVRDFLELGCSDGLSLSLDQEKAFNRVDHRYLLGTLWAFSFGH
ncbi:unnamed protein product [Caretta caretta]